MQVGWSLGEGFFGRVMSKAYGRTGISAALA